MPSTSIPSLPPELWFHIVSFVPSIRLSSSSCTASNLPSRLAALYDISPYISLAPSFILSELWRIPLFGPSARWSSWCWFMETLRKSVVVRKLALSTESDTDTVLFQHPVPNGSSGTSETNMKQQQECHGFMDSSRFLASYVGWVRDVSDLWLVTDPLVCHRDDSPSLSLPEHTVLFPTPFERNTAYEAIYLCMIGSDMLQSVSLTVTETFLPPQRCSPSTSSELNQFHEEEEETGYFYLSLPWSNVCNSLKRLVLSSAIMFDQKHFSKVFKNRFTSLEEIVVGTCWMDDDVLVSIVDSCPRLASVTINIDAQRALRALPRILSAPSYLSSNSPKKLIIEGGISVVTDNGWRYLFTLPHLKHVHVTRLHHISLSCLADTLPQSALQSLSLTLNYDMDITLRNVSACLPSSLRSLRIYAFTPSSPSSSSKYTRSQYSSSQYVFKTHASLLSPSEYLNNQVVSESDILSLLSNTSPTFPPTTQTNSNLIISLRQLTFSDVDIKQSGQGQGYYSPRDQRWMVDQFLMTCQGMCPHVQIKFEH